MPDLDKIKISRSARSSISITILRDGSVNVKAPYLVPIKIIEEFIKTKREWIEAKQKLVKSQISNPRKFENGEKFSYLGKDCVLQLDQSITNITIKEDKIFFPSTLARNGIVVMEKWYQKQAKDVIKKLVDEYASKMKTSYNGITFSDTRSQWGRCTYDNRLQFNWRLIMAPLLVVRYVVIHELAHTLEKNHSKKFWDIVRTANPSYKQQIKWLKTHGHNLIA